MSVRSCLAPLVAASLLAQVGCRTAPLPEPARIPVPAGMTEQQLEVAVLAGILNTPPPPTYDPSSTLSDDDFDRLIWREFVGRARSRSWFPESRREDVLFAAVDTRGLYLRASIARRGDALVIQLEDSRNLRQTATRIHKRAHRWLNNLVAHIRREVGRMSVLARPGAG